MITRDGVALMNARTQNVSIAKETLAVLKQKHYTSPSGKVVDISTSLDAAIKGTILYKTDAELPDTDWETFTPTIEVLNETTARAAVRLLALGKTDIVALNFASARNVGGGFLAGALAQEEDLCRASGLYACTKSKPVFYNENILLDGPFYTDNVIYSPKVPFFRDSYHNFLEAPFELSIISSPAPNLSSLTGRIEGLEAKTKGILRERAIRILDIAAHHGHKNIILGAWGCGAFGNDPKMVSEVFKLALEKIPAFEHVCFATYDDRDPPIVFETFKKIIINT
jgi:uncharacterized protein (TIGR02452 family)